MERSMLKNSSMVDTGDNTRKRPTSAQKGLTYRAVMLAVAFEIAHLAGLREWVTALLEGSKSSLLERIGCSIYLFLYGSVLFVVPVLVIAALLLSIWDAISRRPKV